MKYLSRLVLSSCLLRAVLFPAVQVEAQNYFAVELLDSQTGRGIPLVEVDVGGQRFYTDSNGIAAIEDPILLDQDLSFTFKSYGYTTSSQSFSTTTGSTVQILTDRNNRAERLYRNTGENIYADTVTIGRGVPIDKPLINAQVTGQDSVQAIVYKGKIHWFWGDTLFQAGGFNLRTAGATSELPGQGGLDPSEGVNLNYFENEFGQAKQMYQQFQESEAPGLVWTDGLFTVQDNFGQERLLGHFIRVKEFLPEFSLHEQGLAIFNDASKSLDKILNYDIAPTVELGTGAPITPIGHSFRHSTGGEEYIYFGEAYPNIRVRSNWDEVLDIDQWEAFTPLQENSRYDAANPPLEIGSDGKPVYGWKKNTDPFTTDMLEQLSSMGHISRSQAPFGLVDVETGNDVWLHRASVHWNEYRNKWIMIGNQTWSNVSFLGEVWYAEAPTPEGPWKNAIKIATHDSPDGSPSGDYSFYNPTQLPFFDQDGGRIIYFEGTYSNSISNNPNPTPLYDYNQLMYRLDLSTIPVLSDEGFAADFNADGLVDRFDLDQWSESYGIDYGGDADGDGLTTGNDFLIWQQQLGSQISLTSFDVVAEIVPEPNTATLALLSLLAGLLRSRKPWISIRFSANP